jgi:hypothetical protein
MTHQPNFPVRTPFLSLSGSRSNRKAVHVVFTGYQTVAGFSSDTMFATTKKLKTAKGADTIGAV